MPILYVYFFHPHCFTINLNLIILYSTPHQFKPLTINTPARPSNALRLRTTTFPSKPLSQRLQSSWTLNNYFGVAIKIRRLTLTYLLQTTSCHSQLTKWKEHDRQSDTKGSSIMSTLLMEASGSTNISRAMEAKLLSA
ncbi:hypothetical protein L1887_33019 [Cichorium endivia]|nr:hypothetical protein L1887_33019 [Cichorium endivia]